MLFKYFFPVFMFVLTSPSKFFSAMVSAAVLGRAVATAQELQGATKPSTCWLTVETATREVLSFPEKRVFEQGKSVTE